jgi:DNA-binding transcriptional ArsR family regulator
VLADVDVSSVAALVGEPARARMLQALHDGRALPAGELARRAGVVASTASEHLAKLVEGRLVTVERSGRHRYFRLADDTVATAIEALAVLAPAQRPRSLREATVGEALATARTCYDHLAGKLGVAVTDALLVCGAVESADDGFVLGRRAHDVLRELGVDALSPRRPPVLRCIDWSERRPHVAGGLGAAILGRALEARWIERLPSSRAVRVTPAGKRAFGKLGAIL